MNKTTISLLLLSVIGLPSQAYAQSSDDNTPDPEPSVSQAKQATSANQAKKEQQANQQTVDNDADSTKEDADPTKEKAAKPQQEKSTPNLVKEAAKRHTPPWTNDSANINLQHPRLALDEEVAKPYTAEDFTVKPEWERLFASDEHFSTNSGEELYETMCQACHMADGQGAKGVGYFPSFVGNERLRSPDYPIDVILNGLRGMPHFHHMLNDEQVAGVVNYLRTSFGNQLDGNTLAEDVARVRK